MGNAYGADNPYGGINYFNPSAPPTPAAPAATPGSAGAPYIQAANSNNLLDAIGSPGGQALAGMAGAGLTAWQNYQQDQQHLQQGAHQFAAQTLQGQYNADRNREQSAAQGVLNADPLGADQRYAQHNALMSAILPNLRNVQSHPGDAGVAAAMGGNRGGLMSAIPAGGFDPKMIEQKYGDASTMGAIAKRQNELTNLDSRAPQSNLQSMFGDSAAPYQQQMSDWSTNLQKLQGQEKAAYEQQINAHINAMVQQEQSSGGSGFWHKFAKIAGAVGLVAATVMTAGAATPLAAAGWAALGAGAGAAQSWGSGGSPVMGAITGGAGAALAGGAKSPLMQAIRG